MRRPLGIIFDYGDTVLENTSFDLVAGDRKLLEYVVDSRGLTAKDIQKVADKLNSEIEPLKAQSMIELPVQQFQRLLFGILGLTFGISDAEMEREFWRACVKYRPVEGIYDVLDMLEREGIRTGIISNTAFSGALLEETLEEHNLARRFSFVIASADVGIRKPHPRIFELGLRKIGLTRDDVWFAGDKLPFDVKGACESGLQAVWLNTRNESADPRYRCLEVKSWAEFLEKFRALRGL